MYLYQYVYTCSAINLFSGTLWLVLLDLDTIHTRNTHTHMLYHPRFESYVWYIREIMNNNIRTGNGQRCYSRPK